MSIEYEQNRGKESETTPEATLAEAKEIYQAQKNLTKDLPLQTKMQTEEELKKTKVPPQEAAKNASTFGLTLLTVELLERSELPLGQKMEILSQAEKNRAKNLEKAKKAEQAKRHRRNAEILKSGAETIKNNPDLESRESKAA